MINVYVATIQQNWYDSEPFVEGVYSSKEKAKEGILLTLRELDPDAPLLSLDTYICQEEPGYEWKIEEFKIDE